MKPAWSEQFDAQTLRNISPHLPLDDISAEWAWGGATGAGIKVAILDSGIDASHPAVGEVQGYVDVTEDANDNLVFNTAPHQDVVGHGTACAGIVRAIAPQCELYSVKVLGEGGSGHSTILAGGLRWAIDNGMRVCNLSLGTTRKEFYAALHELADLAYFRNVMLVTAANNMPRPSFPAMFASVISVASCEGQDPYLFYYNPLPPVEFGAPGIDVPVAWTDGATITARGNSFAAPHITGIVAKILSKRSDLNVFQIKSVLRALSANMQRAVAQKQAEALAAPGG